MDQRFSGGKIIWLGRATVSVVDQGLVSGSNFVLNILLAAWLSPSEYGEFAIAQSAFLFLAGFHNSLFLEPVSVLGPASYQDRMAPYFKLLFYLQLVLSLILALAATLIGFGLTFENLSLGLAFWGMSAAMLFLLAFLYLRRICYVRTRPDWAAKASALYAGILLLGLVLLHIQGLASPLWAFGLMGFAAAAASTALLLTLHRSKEMAAVGGHIDMMMKNVVRDHWRYGRWFIGTTFFYWFSGPAYVPIVAAIGGTAEAGIFRAVQNLFLPLAQVQVALTSLLLPRMSARRLVHGTGDLVRIMGYTTVGFGILALGYVAPVVIGPDIIVELLYGTGRYEAYAWLTWYLGFAALLTALSNGCSIYLQASQRPDAIFWSRVAGALVTVTAGVFLVQALGLKGVGLALVIAALTILTVLGGYALALSRPGSTVAGS